MFFSSMAVVPEIHGFSCYFLSMKLRDFLNMLENKFNLNSKTPTSGTCMYLRGLGFEISGLKPDNTMRAET